MMQIYIYINYYFLTIIKSCIVKIRKLFLFFKGICDRKVVVLVGFLYKNLVVTLGWRLHLVVPTGSEASRGGRTDY
jgi:hypothetical protein